MAGEVYMLFNPLVLLYAPGETGRARGDGLSARGFECRYFHDLDVLYAEVRGLADTQGVAAVLMGASIENRNAIFYLRTLQARLGVLAQLQTGSEEEQMSLIQAGADWLCPVGASSDLVATMLLSLWQRPLLATPVEVETAARQCGEWALTEYDWILQDPRGVRVSLTASERALLITLFDGPENSATHDALIAAVNQARDLPSGTGPRTRLGVLISRLRSKCRRRGMDLPIRVIHNKGYMFAASVDAPQQDAPQHSVPPGELTKVIESISLCRA